MALPEDGRVRALEAGARGCCAHRARRLSASDAPAYGSDFTQHLGLDRLLAKSLEGWLTSRIRSHINLELQAVEQFTFGEFVLSLPTPCASFIFDVTNTGEQQGVIDFGREFAFFLVDRLLGGSGRPAVLDRGLSPLERMVVRIVAERARENLMEIWQDHVELDLKLSGFESIPDMIQIANREDPVLVANISVESEDIESVMMLCLPFAVLEKFFTSGGPRRVQVVEGSERERLGIETSLRATRVPVNVRLPQIQLSMGELVRLEEGSVLMTGLSHDTELDIMISGQKRYKGKPGRVRNNLAVRITDPVKASDGGGPAEDGNGTSGR